MQFSYPLFSRQLTEKFPFTNINNFLKSFVCLVFDRLNYWRFTMKLSEFYWHRITPLHFLLWPISVLYGGIMSLKRLCYSLDFFHTTTLPVPVIVVDSISRHKIRKHGATIRAPTFFICSVNGNKLS